MALFRDARLTHRAIKRLGAFKRARGQGMSVADAGSYSDRMCPPTAEDLAFEKRMSAGRVFPWVSAIALLYPIAAMIFLTVRTPASSIMIAGYGLANLGYLLFAAGILAGTFRVLGLKKRWHVLALAIVCLANRHAVVECRLDLPWPTSRRALFGLSANKAATSASPAT